MTVLPPKKDKMCDVCGGPELRGADNIDGSPSVKYHLGSPDRCIVHLRQKIEDLDALLARHILEEHPKGETARAMAIEILKMAFPNGEGHK